MEYLQYWRSYLEEQDFTPFPATLGWFKMSKFFQVIQSQNNGQTSKNRSSKMREEKILHTLWCKDLDDLTYRS